MIFMIKNSCPIYVTENMCETSPIMRQATIFLGVQFYPSFQENPYYQEVVPL